MFRTNKMFGMVAVIVMLAAMNTAMAIWVLSRTAEMSRHGGATAIRTMSSEASAACGERSYYC